MSGSYDALYQAWTSDMEAFWADRARLLDWSRVPQQVLAADDPPFYRWFPDGELNTCHNCLDRHVAAGRGDQPALIYDSPVTETRQNLHLQRTPRTPRPAPRARSGRSASNAGIAS